MGTLVLALIFAICTSPLAWTREPVQQDVLERSIESQLRQLGLEGIAGYRELVDPELRPFLPELNSRDILGSGDQIPHMSLSALLRWLFQMLFSQVLLSAHLLKHLISLAILSGILRQLQSSFGSDGLVDLGSYVCFFILVFIGLQSFQLAIDIATEAVDTMVSFMQALLPVMAALLASVGGVTTAAVFHPMLTAGVVFISSLIRNILFPVLYFSAILGVLAHFSPDLSLHRLAGLAKQAGIIMLSSFFVLFSGLMVIRGAIAPVADGVGIRALKFATGTFIPVVGGKLAEAVEVVVGGSLLIKNVVGVFGVLLIIFLATMPFIQIWAMVLIYKVAGALIQPIGDARLVESLASLETSLTMIMVSVGTVTVMFLICIIVLISFGNLSVVLR